MHFAMWTNFTFFSKILQSKNHKVGNDYVVSFGETVIRSADICIYKMQKKAILPLPSVTQTRARSQLHVDLSPLITASAPREPHIVGSRSRSPWCCAVQNTFEYFLHQWDRSSRLQRTHNLDVVFIKLFICTLTIREIRAADVTDRPNTFKIKNNLFMPRTVCTIRFIYTIIRIFHKMLKNCYFTGVHV